MASRITPILFLLICSLLALSAACDRQPTQAMDDADDAWPHTLAPGASNEAFVADTDFSRLTVQVHYMEGFSPDPGSLQSLGEFLEKWLAKEEVVILTPVQIPGGGSESYSASDIRSLEQEHRSEFTDPGSRTLAAYVLILDGEFESNNVLGVAYNNTSTALFGETIARISGGLGQASRRQVEATVLRHEFGHLMGLVDSPTDMQQPHHDDDHRAHCTDSECLMYYAFEQPDLFQSLFGQQIPDLDPYCEADIRALRGD